MKHTIVTLTEHMKNLGKNNIIGLLGLFVAIVGIPVGIAVALVPQQTKCTLSLLPSEDCKGVYFVSDNAYITQQEANQQAKKLKKEYPESGYFATTKYPNLSVNSLHTVYAGKFKDRNSCAIFLKKYNQRNADAFCFRASANPDVSRDMFKSSAGPDLNSRPDQGSK